MAEIAGNGGGTTPPTAAQTTGTVSAPQSNTLFADYAEYVQQTLLASRIGTVPTITDPAARAEVPAILTDPETIKAYRTSIADQMNAGSQGPTFLDLSERIASVQIETMAQGASTLTVGLIDPLWIIPTSGFITVDETGYIWPPIEIQFPADTGCYWWLCQYAPTWGNNTEANLTLTFEDKIVSVLRQMSAATGGVQQGSPNQTLGGFIQQLVDSTNHTLQTKIRLVELISPIDPNYTLPVTDIPTSAQTKVRHNPNKTDRGLTQQQQWQITQADHQFRLAVPQSGPTTIASGEQSVLPRSASGLTGRIAGLTG